MPIMAHNYLLPDVRQTIHPLALLYITSIFVAHYVIPAKAGIQKFHMFVSGCRIRA